MADTPAFDSTAAHKYFSAENFNKAWEFIEKGERTDEENLAMLHTAIASLWHWTQREDVSAKNLSVGYWQVSRVYNLIKQLSLARMYGLQSLKYATSLEPFFRGYAYETLARAEMQSGNRVVMRHYLEKAFEMLSEVTDEEDRKLLSKDLETIR
jgi:signal transduction histidine kinase